MKTQRKLLSFATVLLACSISGGCTMSSSEMVNIPYDPFPEGTIFDFPGGEIIFELKEIYMDKNKTEACPLDQEGRLLVPPVPAKADIDGKYILINDRVKVNLGQKMQSHAYDTKLVDCGGKKWKAVRVMLHTPQPTVSPSRVDN